MIFLEELGIRPGSFWLWLGFFSQAMFFTRFLIQWVVSETKKSSVIPVSFWYLSILGSVGLLTYSIYRKDPVFIAGQSIGIIIYLRNLTLHTKGLKRLSATEKP
jgi:lipid-A-disaccharide synthase-like uncharacterized protein